MATYIGDIIEQRLSRRAALLGFSAAACVAAVGCASTRQGSAESSLGFEELAHGIGPDHSVAPGHNVRVLIRWGDPLFSDAPPFDAHNQTPLAQARQFGTSCDFTAFFHDRDRNRGVLCVNNEFAAPSHMFPDVMPGQAVGDIAGKARVAMEAVGVSIVELERGVEGWRVRLDGRNRRITGTTPIALSGPVAGHRRVRTAADPDGRTVLGTYGNCAGGRTPWGTYLSCEEGVGLYFSGAVGDDHAEAQNHRAFGLPWSAQAWWALTDERFDLSRHPTEPNRFGWVVEIDPQDPRSTPKKRTALGRFAHEGATPVIGDDGRLVVYMGDDAPFQFIYRFVSDEPVTAQSRADILDRGVLHVARFQADGSLDWLPVLHGQGPLTAENGFESQADVLIECRRAAALLGATPMDRPEDVEANPVTGEVYVVLTGHSGRNQDQVDAANPRANNRYGHVLRLEPPRTSAGARRHTAAGFRWEVFIRCGDPADDRIGADYHPRMGRSGWLANPDNCAFDGRGRLWLATDHGDNVDHADGLWACDTDGPGRALMKHFYRCPAGAEACGPEFAEDDRTLFLSVQHPGVGGAWTAARPLSRWPDFDAMTPPRSSVVVITRDDGGPIS